MKYRFVLISIFLFQFSFHTFGQSDNIPEPTLESPYNTIYTHLYYLQPDSYQPEIAAKTLYGTTDSLNRIDLAIKLKRIFDGRGLYIHLNQLPQGNDFIDSLTQQPYYTLFPVELPQIYLAKTDGKWYYSNESIRQIPILYQQLYPFGTAWLIDLIPGGNQPLVFGLAGWQFLGLLMLIVLAWMLHWVLAKILFFFVSRLAHSRFKDRFEDIKPINKIARAISMLVIVILIKIFLPVLQFPISISKFSILALNIFLTVFVVLLALRILNLLMVYATEYAKTTEKKLDEQLLPIIKRTLNILLVLGGIIQVLSLLEVNVTALLAGISIGGLALALAAQDTVKNLIGSAMIFIDKPFQIGDFIEGSGFAGGVMEVGFRTTRIRTSDTSVLSVPNGSIANMVITNKGLRVYRLFTTELGLTYNTPPALIQVFVDGLRKMVEAHPRARTEDSYIHLNSMQTSSINILFRVFLEVGGYAEELKVKEAFFLGFLTLAEKVGVEFAFPSSTVYVEEFPGKLSNRPSRNTVEEQLNDDITVFLKEFSEKNQDEIPPESV